MTDSNKRAILYTVDEEHTTRKGYKMDINTRIEAYDSMNEEQFDRYVEIDMNLTTLVNEARTARENGLTDAYEVLREEIERLMDEQNTILRAALNN